MTERCGEALALINAAGRLKCCITDLLICPCLCLAPVKKYKEMEWFYRYYVNLGGDWGEVFLRGKGGAVCFERREEFHSACPQLKSFKWPSWFWPGGSLQQFPSLHLLSFFVPPSSHPFITLTLPPAPSSFHCLPLMAFALMDSRPPVVMLVKPIKAGNHLLLFRCAAVCTHRAKRVGRVTADTHTHVRSHTPFMPFWLLQGSVRI